MGKWLVHGKVSLTNMIYDWLLNYYLNYHVVM